MIDQSKTGKSRIFQILKQTQSITNQQKGHFLLLF